MICPLSSIVRFKCNALDGDAGRIEDVYFDDSVWRMRYIVLHGASWFKHNQRVLLSTSAIRDSNPAALALFLNLTREQIYSCSEGDCHEAENKELLRSLHEKFGWPRYWEEEFSLAHPPLYTASGGACPVSKTPGSEAEKLAPRLRKGRDLAGFRLYEKKDDLGFVKDVLFDKAQRVIRYLVIYLTDENKDILVSPLLVRTIDWGGRAIEMDLSERTLRGSPSYHKNSPLALIYDDGVSDYYSCPATWLLNHDPHQMISFNDYQLIEHRQGASQG